MRHLTFLFFFFSLSYCSGAQQPLYSHFKLFKVEDGLPQSFISGLVQDNDGFLWIGTRDGLARYDGREFKIFRHENADSTSLSSSVIIDLYLDPQNLLWVTYVNQKVDCFDPRRLRLSEEKPPRELQQLLSEYKVGKFFKDHSGKFWLNTNYKGIISFDATTKKITPFNTANKNLVSDNNLGSVEDPQGKICVFTDRGLQISNKEGTKMEEFFPFDPGLNFKFAAGTYYKVACLPNGRLVFAQNNRLIIFDRAKKTFSSIFLSGTPEQQDVIKFLVIGADGLLYIQAAGSVFRLEKNLSLTYLWQSSNTNPFGNDARSFIVDRSGVLWFGTNAAGLYKIDLHTIPFANIIYRKNFVTDNLNALPGLTFEKMPDLFKKGSWAYAFRYCYGAGNDLFVSYAETQNAPDAGKVYVYKNGALVPLPDGKVNDLPVKGLSISSTGDLYAVDRLGNIRIWRDIATAPEFIPASLDLNMQTGDVSDIEANGKAVFIAVEKDGLYKIENNRIAAHYFSKPNDKKSLPTNQLTDLCKDPLDKKYIWIGTLGQGLMKWDIDSGLQKIYTTVDGLPNNTIYSIVPDTNKNLWISTNRGICRFDSRAKTFYNFDVTDGLISNEFNRFHHFTLPDGRISFGSFEGYSVFDPSLFEPDNFQTPISFTKLFINNTETQLSAAGINEMIELTLPYNKNFLSFEFAGLQLNQPEKLRYRYMLKGYDKDWIQSGTRNMAIYTRLPPGRYTLWVNASNTSGNWSPVIKRLSIHIKPPFWATWWAYTIYLLIIVMAIRIYWKYRMNRIRLQNEIVLEQNKAVHLQEVDEIKNRFFDNITHEFRTPLTLILTPIEKLTRDVSLSPSHRHVLSNAHRNAEQLLRLINQLLDISKIESGQMKVNLSAGELDKFIENCVNRFSLQAKEKNINLSFYEQDVSGHYSFDEEKLEKIVFNLLSNAIKFTPIGGMVSVSLKSVGKEQSANVELCVADSGIGMPEDKLLKIFDRFYMADDSGTRSHSGTGIGLSLVKELAQLMKGNIEVKSEPGKGTIFVVNLPIERLETIRLEKNYATNDLTAATRKEVEFSLPGIHEGPLLLIVEDNDELRSFIRESLTARWRTMEASNGETAWDIILKELPEIVISDVMMPQMDGMELCRVSKKDDRTQHISFILLTAKAAHQSKLTGLGAGADEYITKPFHIDELELRIENLLQQQERWRKHLQKELLPEKPLPKLPHVNDLFIQKLYQYLDERLDEPNMDVENLAAGMNMNRRTLNRKLKLVLNISANDLIRRYRLQKAATLIASGHSITQTAYTVGFETPSYFTQCFKEQYGQTPTEFAAQKTA